jgi:Uncharacterized protein conserved in bacteria
MIADDFTGALDSGIQFAKHGIRVAIGVAAGNRTGLSGLDDAEVIILDAETRHLDPDQTYAATYAIAKEAIEVGASHLFVKTDSGLRGNIGSMLKAALDVSGNDFLAFLPAFPDSNRITDAGIQYVDGIPIDQSYFGRDPFDPVTSPYVRDLFKGIDVRIAEMPLSQPYRSSFAEPTIAIFDARTNEDLSEIAESLRDRGRLGVVAGCAGFAQVLPDILAMPRRSVESPAFDRPLLVVCGSLNPVARGQIERGVSSGFLRIALEPFQQLTSGYLESEEGRAWLASLEPALSSSRDVVIDTGICEQQTMREYLRREGIEVEGARPRIAGFLGALTKKLRASGHLERRTPMFIGGDTLFSAYQSLECAEIKPVRELDIGTVLSSCVTRGEELWVVSKSGGLGDEELLVRLARRRAVSRAGRAV